MPADFADPADDEVQYDAAVDRGRHNGSEPFGFPIRQAWRVCVLADSDLTNSAKLIAVVLSDMTNAKSGKSWPSEEFIAERIGAKERSIRNGLRALEHAGYISTEHRGRTSNCYEMLLAQIPRHSLESQPGTAMPGRPGKKWSSTRQKMVTNPALACRLTGYNRIEPFGVTESGGKDAERLFQEAVAIPSKPDRSISSSPRVSSPARPSTGPKRKQGA